MANSTSASDRIGASVLAQAFRPAVALVNRLSYARKFILIGVILLAPLAFLLRLQYRGTTDSLEFNAAEQVGIAYIQPAKNFLWALQRRRIMTAAAAAGATNYASEIAGVTAEADAKVSEVDAADKLYGEQLKTTQKWGEIKLAWSRLKGLTANSPESDSAHATVTALVVDLILNYAGNNSNLILDPDLDSYWLMDAWVVKMPLIGESIAGSATVAMGLKQDAQSERLIDVVGTTRILTSTASDLVNVNMKTSFAESKNPKFGQSTTLEANLKDPVQQVTQKVNAYAEHLKSNYFTGKTPAAPAADVGQVAAHALAALQASNVMYDKIGPELDWLCQKRVNNYRGTRSLGLSLGFAAALLLVYVFVGFYLSVQTSAAALASATTRMISGTEDVFELEARDELGKIGGSFNQINQALVEARRLRQQVQSDNEALQENIMDLLQVVSEAADGDLRVRAKISTGALGNVSDAFNHLLESLQGLIGEIESQLNLTNGAIKTIADASRQMAAGANHQTSEVLSATKLVEGMSKDIQRVSENARVAAEAAKRTQSSANEGTQGVNNVIAGMGTLRTNVQAGAKKMKNLGDRSMEITGIVGTITRISEQTNMLALNAAIEAARAGEHGRGFSIVAEEVRKLAERTSAATEEIEKLVKAIHSETTETVEAIEQQTQFVEQESVLVGKAGESLAKISQVSTESATLVAQISDVALKQVEGVGIIVKTMDQISSIAKSTQSGAEGTATTVQRLSELSAQLTGSIRRFKLSNGHNGATV